MKIAYWGHYKQIIHSKNIRNIKYFVFENEKSPKELLEYARKNNVRYYLIKSKNDMLNILKDEEIPDLTIVGSFGKIFTPEMIEYVERKIINIHPGILPFYRGRHPLPQAILNKETEMGITAHVLNQEIDYGEIITLKKLKIDYSKSYKFNEQKLYNLVPDVFDETIKKYIKREIKFLVNKGKKGTYYKPLNKNLLRKVINSNILKELFYDEKNSN
ncbi:formyltransferase family protein [Crassaminicella indica]|uniref:Formyl transferase N-terminal domain-containing protein n=1 Tax=Crassaminicella indica TaxID=2855394 RepID=A0ABX8R828_9CLOT|nr:formyltransferase family protein [Crassaminicella indica]QXM05178.1 hypothetical protein KVH43_07170 [Crassaminicella indica]